jgi:hypothetical protein
VCEVSIDDEIRDDLWSPVLVVDNELDDALLLGLLPRSTDL